MDFGIIKMHPNGTLIAKKLPKVNEPIAHQGKPYGMLKVIFVRIKRLLCIEWRIDINQLNVANVFFGKLRHSCQRFEHIARFAIDKQVIGLWLKVCPFRIIQPFGLRSLPPRTY